jgi:alpha-beta hydrolase superfamily lysophospholipase
MASQDIKPFAARLELPVLFVTAERDAFGANRAALLFYRLAPSKEKQLLVMPGSAHGTQLLKDAGLVRRVLGFINAHR